MFTFFFYLLSILNNKEKIKERKKERLWAILSKLTTNKECMVIYDPKGAFISNEFVVPEDDENGES